ncbi:LOW QUALITY PROTEIN: tigger transposable element-derived 4-like protein [Plakobranchus ocellatus]|uniref:Tigger transposable element-derived 4-like protein n=1 Tax=Plakobranchus ocellatus TaxID=259542 RepID=A0AAV4B8Z8_9GAST|nr:LOW QUALITY PROTEIN: tigger transposable element-derived 4-like protein [Plakobranchus ocellatus]
MASSCQFLTVLAATPSNISSGFRVSGTWPLNKEAFHTEEFLPSAVTDRPLPQGSEQAGPSAATDEQTSWPLPPEAEQHGPPTESDEPTMAKSPSSAGPSSSTVFAVTPEDIHAFPKAPERKESARGKKRGKTMIATSTPEMTRLKEEAEKKKGRSLKVPAKKLFDVVDDDSASDMSVTDILERDENELKLGVVESVKVNQYVVCEFAKKTQRFYYVGCVVKEIDDDGDIEVDFLRRKGSYFIKPLNEDICSLHMSTVKAVLPDPTVRGPTARTKGELVFSVVFGDLDLR